MFAYNSRKLIDHCWGSQIKPFKNRGLVVELTFHPDLELSLFLVLKDIMIISLSWLTSNLILLVTHSYRYLGTSVICMVMFTFYVHLLLLTQPTLHQFPLLLVQNPIFDLWYHPSLIAWASWWHCQSECPNLPCPVDGHVQLDSLSIESASWAGSPRTENRWRKFILGTESLHSSDFNLKLHLVSVFFKIFFFCFSFDSVSYPQTPLF